MSQLSLLPAHRPDERRRVVEPPPAALFAMDVLDACSRPAQSAESDLAFPEEGGRRADKDERAERLAKMLGRLLLLDGNRSLVKALCRRIEQRTGRVVGERTARGWFEGREPSPDGWADLEKAFGRGLRAYVFYPESEAARRWWAEVYSRGVGPCHSR